MSIIQDLANAIRSLVREEVKNAQIPPKQPEKPEEKSLVVPQFSVSTFEGKKYVPLEVYHLALEAFFRKSEECVRLRHPKLENDKGEVNSG